MTYHLDVQELVNLHNQGWSVQEGLMQSDGTNQLERWKIQITLKESDSDLLHDVARVMEAPRILRKNRVGGVRLDIYSKQASRGLASWGVVSPKSHTASTHPDMLGDRDYWRGVIDGDGTLCEAADGRHLLALVGSRPICDQFLAFCRTKGCGARRSVTPHKAIWSTGLSGTEARTMAAVLYQDAEIALHRKRVTAERWIAYGN